jgi:two-component system, LytTR family, response regulator
MSTNKIRTIIIDDENLARKLVKSYLNDHDEIEITAECSNGFEGIKAINETKPDLIFLDIQMPKINGFEMLELIEDPPVIIFTTAFDQYALKAFEVNAADYLLKPYSKERFDEAVSKASQMINNKPAQKEIINNLLNYKDELKEFLRRIVIKDGTKISIIPVDSIFYIEAQDDYVMIYSSEGKFLKQKTMKFLEDNLDPKEFVRVHRSYIVSIKQINKIELEQKESYKILLKNGIKIPVSKTGYAKLKQLM